MNKDADERRRLMEQHREALRSLEAEETAAASRNWPPSGFYLVWHLVIGMMLGSLGAVVSLAANFIGAPLFGQPPMQLIRVYLTFPMGARALEAEEGLVLSVGCLLYLVTGALYGIAFHLLMRTLREASPARRLLIATLFGLGLWIFNFYLILSWLQPLLLDGNWIVRMVPVWVGALTHLAFAWTMLAGELWGRFEPYRGGR